MKKIIIIGGGFAGAYCAQNLENNFDVTLIDTKDYFEFTPSVLRTLVEPEHAAKIEVCHQAYLSKARVLREEVLSITDTLVKTTEKKILYDYLIIATGSRYNLPIKEKNMVIAERGEELRKYSKKLEEANTILIIGGGLVGVELAAEISTTHPEKKITIVHAHSEFIERNPLKARVYVQNFLERKGVKFIFNERVVNHKKGVYMTDKHTSISCDLAFLCTGIAPNSESLQNFALTDKKYLQVNDYLQVPGHFHIFAAGDIVGVAEEKTAQNAEIQAEIVVKNIYNREKGKSLQKYVSSPRIMIISLGKLDGILVYKNFVLTGFIPGILKRLIEWKTMRKYRR
ncbi:MAG: FAD-dependent oxidoreductase [Nanoarchaeota archaeon]|nr:FAD-dependent oxidoreductase [Nanoarchaeota archaeon]